MCSSFVRAVSIALLLASTAAAQSSQLDFELGGPCEVTQAVAASSEYASEGALFVGPAPGWGGVIIDDCGSIQIPARSGHGMLVVAEEMTSRTGPAVGPVQLDLTVRAARVTVHCLAEIGYGTYQLTAFDGGVQVAQGQVGAFGWTAVTVGMESGFDRLVIEEVQGADTWAVDDVTLLRCPATVGVPYCASIPAGFTSPTCLTAQGAVSGGGPYTSLTLAVDGGQPGLFGVLLVSPNGNWFPLPGGAPWLGAFCVVPGPVRLMSNVFHVDGAGHAQSVVDLTTLPFIPTVAVMPGDTWYFQAWHRHESTWLTSAFSNALEVSFQ